MCVCVCVCVHACVRACVRVCGYLEVEPLLMHTTVVKVQVTLTISMYIMSYNFYYVCSLF